MLDMLDLFTINEYFVNQKFKIIWEMLQNSHNIAIWLIFDDMAYKLHENLLVPYRDNGHLTNRNDSEIITSATLLQELSLRERLAF